MKIKEFLLHEKELLSANKINQVIQDLKTVFRNDDEFFNTIIAIESQYNRLLEIVRVVKSLGHRPIGVSI